jgi:hypothetical protein
MTLIKSKINSLAWLNSAMCVSVAGGVILSSMPVLAATLSAKDETETSVSLTVKQDLFGNNAVSPLHCDGLKYWKCTFNIEEVNGDRRDDLVVRVYLQHIGNPHPGDSGLGEQLNLNFRLGSFSTNPSAVDADVSEHPGVGHRDNALGYLTMETVDNVVPSDIKKWEVGVFAAHNVPEPTTMLSAAVALGWGGWLKQKNSIKKNKTKS